MSYIFGGDTPQTQDAVQERRRIARQLLARSAQRPQTWSDGLASSVAAFAASRNNRLADRGEAALQGLNDQSGMPAEIQSAPPPAPENVASEVAKAMMSRAQQPVNGAGYRDTSRQPAPPFEDSLMDAEMRAMMPGASPPPNPMAQPEPTQGASAGGYRDTSRKPPPPFEEQLMDAEMRAMMFERDPSGKDARTRRQEEAFTPERVEEEGPPPSPQELQAMAQGVGIDPAQLQGLDLNTSEARNFGYLLRMMEAENTIRELSDANTWGNRLLEHMIPGQSIESFLMDPDYRRFMVARENFNEAALRAATGATINQSEMPTQRQNYFPLPNDDEETRALIERQRQALMMALSAGSGPAGAIIPPFGEPVVPRQTQAAATMRFNPETGQLEQIQ